MAAASQQQALTFNLFRPGTVSVLIAGCKYKS